MQENHVVKKPFTDHCFSHETSWNMIRLKQMSSNVLFYYINGINKIQYRISPTGFSGELTKWFRKPGH